MEDTMTDPPLQSYLRFIAIDIHKHYLMIGAIDAAKQVVLLPRRVELSRWPKWAHANLLPTDAVVTHATTNAWANSTCLLLWSVVPSWFIPPRSS